MAPAWSARPNVTRWGIFAWTRFCCGKSAIRAPGFDELLPLPLPPPVVVVLPLEDELSDPHAARRSVAAPPARTARREMPGPGGRAAGDIGAEPILRP